MAHTSFSASPTSGVVSTLLRAFLYGAGVTTVLAFWASTDNVKAVVIAWIFFIAYGVPALHRRSFR